MGLLASELGSKAGLVSSGGEGGCSLGCGCGRCRRPPQGWPTGSVRGVLKGRGGPLLCGSGAVQVPPEVRAVVRAVPAHPINGHRSSVPESTAGLFFSAVLPLAPHLSSVLSPRCPDSSQPAARSSTARHARRQRHVLSSRSSHIILLLRTLLRSPSPPEQSQRLPGRQARPSGGFPSAFSSPPT